jgi:predicted N-acetyltransferase YhbS
MSAATGRAAVVVRDARPADAAAVFALLGELGYPQESVEAVAGRIERLRADPSGRVLVAEVGAEVVAAAGLWTIPHVVRDSHLGRLTSLVVRADRRGQGVGEALVRAAEAEARRRGCTTMEVTSSRHRAGAHAFYARLGYTDATDRSGLFRRTLGGTDGPEEDVVLDRHDAPRR